ncbi:MAG: hypothetical protein AB8B65_06785 [Kordia sp.]|uniref:hypothetical protein n=1 Tax=Kordia sp. TaxID=1965332 RepID=UPI0038593C51
MKSLALREQSVSNLNKTFGRNASVDVSDIINTIIDLTEKYTRVFLYCPHVSCCCPDLTIPPLTEGKLTCVTCA